MTALRRLAILALLCTFVQSVFGAIVRISGSGMGCGEHWPDCNGAWIPAFTDYRVVIEVTHRYLAVGAVITSTLALVVLSLARRDLPGVRGRDGVLRAALLALGLEVGAGLVGSVVVLMSLSNRYLIAVHYAIAMATLATLVVTVQRAGGLGASRDLLGASDAATSGTTDRAALAAAALAFVTIVCGALTANVPGAAASCPAFPGCPVALAMASGVTPARIQLIHRVLALLLFLHLVGLAIVVTRRREAPAVIRAVYIALGVTVLQIGVAAALVALRLPPVLQSMHQATGTLLWIAICSCAALAHRSAPRAVANAAASRVGTPAGAVA